LAQLDGATYSEVEALRTGGVSLSLHAVITRHAGISERSALTEVVADLAIKAREVDALLVALGWNQLAALGDRQSNHRLALFRWACQTLTELPPGSVKERLNALALRFPTSLDVFSASVKAVGE